SLRLWIGPVVELALATSRCESTDVRTLGVRALEILVRDVALFVPVVLLGDAEVDERPVPDVRKPHRAPNVTPRTGLIRRGRTSPPPRRQRDSPCSFPSTARAGRGRARARQGGENTVATLRRRRSRAASSSARAHPRRARGSAAAPPARLPTSSPRRKGSPR